MVTEKTKLFPAQLISSSQIGISSGGEASMLASMSEHALI